MRKQKNNKQKLILVIGLVMTLILGYRGYQAGWFENNGSTNNLGAVTASQTSDGKLVTGAKAVSASASSPQPVITVTSWPTFEMKLDSTSAENNLVVKAEYSVTAKGGKLFIPANWSTMSITNSLGQYSGNPTKVEMMPLDAASASAPCWSGSCYVIPQDKTIRFRVRQVYNPKTMFGGVYTGRLTYLHFSPVASYTPPIDPVTGLPSIENWPLYYKDFPSQTSKLNTVTVVGEKSPYVYTTVVETQSSQQFTIKGVRLTGANPFIEGNTTPENVISRSDTDMTLAIKTTPGVYTLYLNHPMYGKSNKIQLTVKKTGIPEVSLVSSNASINPGDGNDDDIGVFTIRYVVEAVGGPIYISKNAKAIATTTAPYNVSDGMGVLFLITDSGMPVTTGLTNLVTFTTSGGASEVKNGVYLEEGESTDMTLTVLRTNVGQSTDDGIYQVLLKGIGWATTDTPIFNIYQPKGIENYKTTPISLN